MPMAIVSNGGWIVFNTNLVLDMFRFGCCLDCVACSTSLVLSFEILSRL